LRTSNLRNKGKTGVDGSVGFDVCFGGGVFGAGIDGGGVGVDGVGVFSIGIDGGGGGVDVDGVGVFGIGIDGGGVGVADGVGAVDGGSSRVIILSVVVVNSSSSSTSSSCYAQHSDAIPQAVRSPASHSEVSDSVPRQCI
jgi:hypothetical protein